MGLSVKKLTAFLFFMCLVTTAFVTVLHLSSITNAFCVRVRWKSYIESGRLRSHTHKQSERNCESPWKYDHTREDELGFVNPGVSNMSSLWTKPKALGSQVDSLYACLDALNLTNYYRTLDYLTKVELNVNESLQTYLRLLEPSTLVNTSLNHCHYVRTEMNLNSTHLTGFMGKYRFEQQTNGIYSFILQCIRNRIGTAFNYSLTYACLPRVLLAGFPKCGTTFLHKILKSHPNVYKSIAKEPHQWDKIPASSRGFEALTTYLALYVYNYAPRLDSQLQVAIDSTPQTVVNWPQFQGESWRINVCLPPAILHTLLPEARFIIVMRNPVDAVYSLFWYSCTRCNGSVPKEMLENGADIFHDRVTSLISEFKQCEKWFPIAKCMMDVRYNQTLSKRPEKTRCGSSLQCGAVRMDVYMYYIHIMKWLAVYPNKQFTFVTLEELSGKYVNTALKQLWNFLGIDTRHKLPQHLSRTINEQQKVDYHHDPQLVMRTDTRLILEDFYRPFNRKLAELLNDLKFQWK